MTQDLPDRNTLKQQLNQLMEGTQDSDQFLKLFEPAMASAKTVDLQLAQALSTLIDDVETKGRVADLVSRVNNHSGTPLIIVSQEGEILAANPAFSSMASESSPAKLAGFKVSRAQFEAFKARTESDGSTSLIHLTFSEEEQLPIIFSGRYLSLYKVYAMSSIEVVWSMSTYRALGEMFGLTDAERDILLCLARGLSANQISEQRDSKLSTVRQQIKSILQKTHSNSQTQIATLAASLSDTSLATNHVPLSDLEEHGDFISYGTALLEPADASAKPYARGEHVRNGRRIEWCRFGKPGGEPVLLMHSGFFGVGASAAEIRTAESMGYDVMCIVRPGFGRSEVISSADSPLITHVLDCQAILETHSLKPTRILANDFGFVFALKYAYLLPDQIQRIHAISPIPLYNRKESFHDVNILMRAFFWATKHTFWLVRTLELLAHARARRLGPERWVELLFKDSPHEMDVFSGSEGAAIARNAFFYVADPGGKGGHFDLQACVAEDWSSLLVDNPARISILTGGLNTTFTPRSVKAISSHNPSVHIEVIKDAGLTLALTHPERCYREMD